MTVPMVGQNPIEFYYPDGFGELNIYSTTITDVNDPVCFDWVNGPNLNYRYASAGAPTPIYENTQMSSSRTDCKSPRLAVKAVYRSVLSPATGGAGGFATPRTVTPLCVGGMIKYAYISGKLPDTLTFNIDTGVFSGCIPELDTFLGKEELGSEMQTPRPVSLEDVSAEETYGFDFGEQGERKYGETNYASGGSAALYNGNFPSGVSIPFIVRAFDSTAPTEKYIDGSFSITVFNNWSSDRDSLILNIRNQMYLDGKPVTNFDYLKGRKSQGYFDDCCGCPCEE
jgi:hypothetical protein